MRSKSPTSLTATIHVSFDYHEPEPKTGSQDDIDLLNRIFDQASNLPDDMQQVLIRFARYLAGLEHKKEGWSP